MRVAAVAMLTILFDPDHVVVQDQLLTGADGLHHLQVHRVAAIRGNFHDPTDVLLPFAAGLRRVIRRIHIVRAIVAHVEAQVVGVAGRSVADDRLLAVLVQLRVELHLAEPRDDHVSGAQGWRIGGTLKKYPELGIEIGNFDLKPIHPTQIAR